MNGEMEIKSKEEVGTTVKITLPFDAVRLRSGNDK